MSNFLFVLLGIVIGLLLPSITKPFRSMFGNWFHNAIIILTNKHGIVVRSSRNGWSFFVPCSHEAKLVLKKHAEQIKIAKRCCFDCYTIPSQLEKELYEACSHDADDPQCMVRTISL